jgi:hypothetical protein
MKFICNMSARIHECLLPGDNPFVVLSKHRRCQTVGLSGISNINIRLIGS